MILLFLLLTSYVQAGKDANITLAYVSNYCSIKGLAYYGSQVLNFPTVYDTSIVTPYALSSYIYFPDIVMTMAVDYLNNNSSILSGVHVNIKRFSDCGEWYPGVEDEYTGASGGYATSIMVSEIIERNPDVIGIIGNQFSTAARPVAEAFSVYQIPYCSMASTSPRLSNKNNFPYFFRIMPSAGLGEHIRQMLRSWSVKRITIIIQQDDDMGSQYALDIATTFRKYGISVHAIGLNTNFNLEDAISASVELKRESARYFVLSGQQPFVSSAYYLFAKQQLVGPQFVWISYTFPLPYGDPLEIFGPDYFSLLEGFILVGPMEPNTSTPLFQKVFNNVNAMSGVDLSLSDFVSVYTLNPAYDCVMQMLLGFDKLLKSDSKITIASLASRSLQKLMNYTLFTNLGYYGLAAAPVVLNSNGDLKVPTQMYYFTGNSSNTILFGRTDLLASYFWYYPNMRPKFFGGSSNPPVDGPPVVVKSELVADMNSSEGVLILFFAVSGILGCVAAAGFTYWYRKERVIKQSTVYFLYPVISGCALWSSSLLCLFDRPTILKCQTRIWLQVLGFSTVMTLLFVKVRQSAAYLKIDTKNRIGRLLRPQMAVFIGIVCLTELILLGLWSGMNVHTIKQLSFPTHNIYICFDPDYRNSTVIALFAFNTGLLCITASVIFMTEDQEFFVGEAKYPAVIVVSYAFAAIIVLPLLATADSDLSSSVTYATALWMLVWITLVSIFLPKVILVVLDALGNDFGIGSLLKEVTAGLLTGSSMSVTDEGQSSSVAETSSRLRRGLSNARQQKIKRDNSVKRQGTRKKTVKALPMGILCCRFRKPFDPHYSSWKHSDITINSYFERYWILVAAPNTSASFGVNTETFYDVLENEKSATLWIWNRRKSLWMSLRGMMGFLPALKMANNFNLQIEFSDRSS
ncbi:periplasmic binding protein-like I, partial [Obelidium mucronatum]